MSVSYSQVSRDQLFQRLEEVAVLDFLTTPTPKQQHKTKFGPLLSTLFSKAMDLIAEEQGKTALDVNIALSDRKINIKFIPFRDGDKIFNSNQELSNTDNKTLILFVSRINNQYIIYSPKTFIGDAPRDSSSMSLYAESHVLIMHANRLQEMKKNIYLMNQTFEKVMKVVTGLSDNELQKALTPPKARVKSEVGKTNVGLEQRRKERSVEIAPDLARSLVQGAIETSTHRKDLVVGA